MSLPTAGYVVLRTGVVPKVPSDPEMLVTYSATNLHVEMTCLSWALELQNLMVS